MPPEGSQEGSNVEVRNVDLMDDGLESHDGSAIGDPMMEQYEVNPDDGDDADEEPAEIPYDGDEEEEMTYYSDTQIAFTQPLFTQGGLEEDPSNEFEVGQQFGNKEEVLLAVKQYSIRRAVECKIVESDHWRYNARCRSNNQPVSSRICNNMDDVEHNGEKRCGLCRQIRHTRKTCTALSDGGASSSKR
ncbi:hypothetical protein Ahy_B01g051845 [Arachis hypogaea]|uniref:Transposase MuDR plant domain-containing protein n=1 Tax=Arachis hypogaea TaxID=3818 RepID=A0A445AMW2_ARAHY|nr:hypothetical protein Ahy_B01g051845 [Arachis hypogaea]